MKPYASSFFRRLDGFDFFLQIFAVVFGIAITFWGQSLIDDYKESKDIKSSLQLVVDELTYGLDRLEYADSIWNEETKAIFFLRRFVDDFYSAPKDSLEMYCNTPLYLVQIETSENALDLMKASGLFSKMKDKSLALDIIQAYDYIKSYVNEQSFYYEEKLRMINAFKNEKFQKMMNQGATTVTPELFWTTVVSSTEGRYYLEEQCIKHQLVPGISETRDSVMVVIEKIQAFCK